MAVRDELIYVSIRAVSEALERDWGQTPYLKLSCLGGTDEHWQIFDPRVMEYPQFTMDLNGMLEIHPDAK